MDFLVFNPGGNSLKVEVVRCHLEQRYAFEAEKLISVGIEGIGHEPKLLRFENKKTIANDPIVANDYGQAAASFLRWYENQRRGTLPALNAMHAIGVRVVHGGMDFSAPALIDASVEKRIIDFERLAPLHNKSSVEILEPIRKNLPRLPVYGVFDTAFHHTIPDRASMYAIPPELAEKHQIRRYGFHGISHRYLLERYAYLAGKSPSACNIVSMHLESGCSVTAVRCGKSVDNTMGLTPLEGLMMGTRC